MTTQNSKAVARAAKQAREAEAVARAAEIEYATAQAEAEAEAEAARKEEEEEQRKMSKQLGKYKEGYKEARAPGGGKSLNNGDGISKALELRTPKETAALADKVKGEPEGTHHEKYQHLNAGQIRMNSGNRIRAAYKAAIKDGNKDEANRIRAILGLEAI